MILVFGKSGQLAREIARRAPDALCLGREDADLTRPEGCARLIRYHRPTAVINAAAYTAVDRAESDEDTARRINADAPAALARASADVGCPFVHVSTDYVFAGDGETPFSPEDGTAPLGAYGRTKLAGEEGVRAAGGVHAILRTSWVFSAHGGNFVASMLRLSATRDMLSIVGDQIGGPTPAGAIAEACLTIASRLARDPSLAGTYHFSGAPDVSWAGFAEEIFRQSGRSTTVTPIPSSQYPTPARRPMNSRLDCGTLHRFGLERPDWASALREVLSEMSERSEWA
ncbi:dTDP-4-dehydrorhamnose reductase [Roseicyclus sp. F158]|uniref:dTDP-4-dehydrorhamnose reductase n=1 Tax=Tropicimonas omnivorans TaxID=3075590 RepID=A0ABU3DHP8_9RHOB|nr:dTDP-4-dehydrorhamnose reductase [Roseicyclus sp. F158]MDT0683242.1 dTDP-4-dehydrorhamnose reductase [Roseicyclus sp. F158]